MDCDAFRDEMMDLLYGEASPAVTRRMEEHEAACSGCREEVASFRRLRRDLAAWRVPAELGATAPARARARPYLAAAAALVLLLGGGLVLRGSEVRYEQGRFAFRLGASGPDEVRAALSAREARQRQEMQALRLSLASTQRNEDELLRKVQEMIAESEARQTSAVTAGLERLEERTEARRQYDLAQVGVGLSYLDGKAGLQAARTTELMGHLLQASQKK